MAILHTSENKVRVGFLFNHYLTYQVLHGAPLAFELSRMQPDFHIELLCSTPQLHAEAERVATVYPDHRCIITLLRQTGFSRFTPAACQRPLTLITNNKLLASFNALIAPEKNYIILKALPSFRDTRFIGLRHGAGDRPVSFNKGRLKFDCLLVPGQAYFERFKDELPEGCCEVVGYPKFEVLEKLNPATTRLFDNERPVVLYTPHFHRRQSSWIKMGRQVLNYFAKSDTYNLIFAPHARLFKQRLYHNNININEFSEIPHILIDTGSGRSFDMTYTRAADIYLGDVSSQVYEFIYHRRRPCVFLNPNDLAQEGMNFWRFGPVIKDIDGLDAAFALASDGLEQVYRPEQDHFVSTAFSSDARPPSRRGAEAILRFLQR